MNRELFEEQLLKDLKAEFKQGRYDPKYHTKKDNDGEYICYETRIAWKWWCRSSWYLQNNLLSRIEAQIPKDEWQPIETAPKEGYIWAFEQGYGIHKSWRCESDEGSGWRNPYHGWQPTHWMPLPTEPDCKAE